MAAGFYPSGTCIDEVETKTLQTIVLLAALPEASQKTNHRVWRSYLDNFRLASYGIMERYDVQCEELPFHYNLWRLSYKALAVTDWTKKIR